jgi:pimeloyl-ACP methyl ester carboxylesterase
MERSGFTAATSSGDLAGYVTGAGPSVLALHGGPGMSWDYLDDAVAEVAARYRVACFQQRGVAPSTELGAFTIAEAVADIAAALDALEWDTAYLMGHSWGGHLAFHAAVDISARLEGVLSVDPLGAVGDGGAEAFAAELMARVSETDRARVQALEHKESAEGLTLEEDVEEFSLLWPSYFADPDAAPPLPRVMFSQPANEGLWSDVRASLPGLEAALPSITVPVGVLLGELSPMPISTGLDTAERIPGAWSHVQPGAGHFVWHEAPGSVLAAMDRLAAT